jgi:tRNA threonylcarbamoyladenosine biosynthesis protein TsaE
MNFEKTFNMQAIDTVAAELINFFPQTRVFAFEGNMGAGKTTFISACCRALGVTEPTASPTFALINQYLSPSAGLIYHADLYRLKDEAEAYGAGMEDLLYSGQYCFFEWPERAPRLFPDETVYLHLEAISATERRISVVKQPVS